MKDKLMSGRFILTMASALVFVVLSIRGKLPVEAIVTILSTVFALYFTRQDRSKSSGGTT